MDIMKSAIVIIVCAFFTRVFTSPLGTRTNNPSNSDNGYQLSNGPNTFPQVNNGPNRLNPLPQINNANNIFPQTYNDPNLYPQINNGPSQFNPLSQTNNGLDPSPPSNSFNPLSTRKENSENEDIKAPKNYFYSYPRAMIIKIYYISGKSEPYDEPDAPVTSNQSEIFHLKSGQVGSSARPSPVPIPTCAISSLCGGNFG
uniref:GATA zinc finger domain-containing protein 14-like isoform X2 n=1 Tax=Diabrotica virgifera virgifera TaxID=50390 RepID=A0A6P7H4S1_DIAVI